MLNTKFLVEIIPMVPEMILEGVLPYIGVVGILVM